MRGLNHPQHPLWGLIRFTLLCGCVTFLLWRNAETFDETEVKTIIEIAVLSGGAIMGESLLRKKGSDETTKQ